MSRALLAIAVGVITVDIVAGFVIWAVDETNFPNPWLGMWWALQTVTTVGYGDVVPETLAGRIFGGLIMVIGIGVVSLLTATIASELVARREAVVREEERREELTLEDAVRRIEDRLDRIENALER